VTSRARSEPVFVTSEPDSYQPRKQTSHALFRVRRLTVMHRRGAFSIDLRERVPTLSLRISPPTPMFRDGDRKPLAIAPQRACPLAACSAELLHYGGANPKVPKARRRAGSGNNQPSSRVSSSNATSTRCEEDENYEQKYRRRYSAGEQAAG
jgi:hypothetical protein